VAELVAKVTDPTDDFAEHLRQQVLGAYGFDSQAELDAATEEALPGYLAAEAEYNAERDAFAAELPGRVEEVQRTVYEQLREQGLLPDGIEFALTPMDLEADALWMAQVPDWWAQGEPIPGTGDHEISTTSVTTKFETVPMPPLGASAIRAVAEFEQRTAVSLRQLTEQWAAIRTALAGPLEQLAQGLNAAALALQKLGFRLQVVPGARTCPHQSLGKACDFCYPPPFPAARDYRRRTKHRNRRRKP